MHKKEVKQSFKTMQESPIVEKIKAKRKQTLLRSRIRRYSFLRNLKNSK